LVANERNHRREAVITLKRQHENGNDPQHQGQQPQGRGEGCEPPPASQRPCSGHRLRRRWRAESIQFEHNALWLATQNEWFYSSILHLDVDGTTTKVLLRDMQRHPFKQQILHLDFQRVDENQPIRFNVPLHFLNQERSPAGKTAGVIVTHELNEIEVLCLPRDLPEFIEVDLTDAGPGRHRAHERAQAAGGRHAAGAQARQVARPGRSSSPSTRAPRKWTRRRCRRGSAEVPSTKAAKAAAAPAAAAAKAPAKGDKKK
jgi:large subunit ribosomal protein L25